MTEQLLAKRKITEGINYVMENKYIRPLGFSLKKSFYLELLFILSLFFFDKMISLSQKKTSITIDSEEEYPTKTQWPSRFIVSSILSSNIGLETLQDCTDPGYARKY